MPGKNLKDNGELHFVKEIDGKTLNLCNREEAKTNRSTDNVKKVTCMECALALKGEGKREQKTTTKKAG